MKVPFDQGTPVPLRHALPGDEVSTSYEMGGSTLLNGELLTAAESAGFAAIVTTDKNIRHQQSVAGRSVGILVLPTTQWARIRLNAAQVADGLSRLRPGSVYEVSFDPAG